MSTDYHLKSSEPELKHLNQTFSNGCQYNLQPVYQQSSRSLESVYSSNASPKSTILSMYKRKSRRLGGGGGGNNNNNQQSHQAGSEVRQRVISARLHRVRSLQNQLGDAQNHITELNNEIRVLRTLHKRQDSALAKYESHKGDLPKLLHSHAEELRICETKICNLQKQKKELERINKQKDNYILILTDENKRFQQLSSDKHLEDRETLADRVRYLERRILEKDDEIKVLLRRTQLESKNFKFQLAAEQHKYKTLLSKYESNIASETSQMTTGKSSKRISLITRSTAALIGNTDKLPLNKPIFQDVQRTLTTNNSSPSTKITNPTSKLSPRSVHSNDIIEEPTVSAESHNNKNLTAAIHKQKSTILNPMRDKENLAKIIQNRITEVNEQQQETNWTQSDESFENLTNEDSNEDDDDEGGGQVNDDEDVDESETSQSDSSTNVDSGKTEKKNSNNTANVVHENSSSNVVDIDNQKLNDNTRVEKSSNSSRKNVGTTLEYYREDILKSESFLDSFCDNLTSNHGNKRDKYENFLKDNGGGDSTVNTFDGNLNRTASVSTLLMTSRAHEHLTMNRRQFIDPKQKSKLLQSLKAIDSN